MVLVDGLKRKLDFSSSHTAWEVAVAVKARERARVATEEMDFMMNERGDCGDCGGMDGPFLYPKMWRLWAACGVTPCLRHAACGILLLFMTDSALE